MNTILNKRSTGVAAKNTNRNFIGIEKDDKYFAIAKERIEKQMPQIELFNESQAV